jgi:hypothetical protein
MGLSAMNTLIGLAKGADVCLYILDQCKGEPLLAPPGEAADRTQFA